MTEPGGRPEANDALFAHIDTMLREAAAQSKTRRAAALLWDQAGEIASGFDSGTTRCGDEALDDLFTRVEVLLDGLGVSEIPIAAKRQAAAYLFLSLTGAPLSDPVLIGAERDLPDGVGGPTLDEVSLDNPTLGLVARDRDDNVIWTLQSENGLVAVDVLFAAERLAHDVLAGLRKLAPVRKYRPTDGPTPRLATLRYAVVVRGYRIVRDGAQVLVHFFPDEERSLPSVICRFERPALRELLRSFPAAARA